ncbi:outer membrane beta-barrel family protein [Mucilaginibacter sp. KACC 22063]|uniref:outer membrane beta-barrel family protein n=1 Tax=Mucilaginibacter sp. KACC 22063 TaxID=3025666 RepID=UPI002366F84C|nr:outer membrane beta-barrel family protein [Mucilaginibacter sp. KACC 22063]WDF55580.1 outer membrane beta-barrel family protein [Mucilaginibacter sp. KACC 22063]
MRKIKLKPFCILILLICIFQNLLAQNNGGYYLKGVVQSTSNEALVGATILLKDGLTGKTLKQTQGNQDGAFSFDINAGNYILAVSYLGSLSYQSELIKLTGSTDLGVLKINTATVNLKEVVIKSSVNKPAIKIEGRKMIYNVQSSITAQGNNVLEALKKTPGVIVSQDNSVTINGASGALIMINGRQTYLQPEDLAQLMKSMSASDLKSIEIIKNPSAEYDAAGTGGIINLVLKKSVNQGFNGSINNGIAYGKTLKQNTNLSLTYRKDKLNLFANYNHAFGYYAMDYDNDRTTNGKIYLNANHDIDKKHYIGTNIGADYEIDTTKTIGFVAGGNFSSGGGLITPITNIFEQPTGQLIQTLRSQSSYPKQLANRYNFNLNYRYKGRNNTNLNIDADYGIFDASTNNLSTNTYFTPDGQFQSANNFLVANSRNIKLYAIKADYGFPIGKGKMSAGGKYSNVDANNVFDQYDANGPVNVIDINLSNTFRYREGITAGYLRYETPLNDKLSLDLGVRAENTHSEGDLQPRQGSSQQPTSVIRNYLNLFPTASVNYKTEKSGSYNLSFARRVDRPAYNNLNPFSYPVDELSYWKGNPFLQPQYANSIALQYSYSNTTIAAGYTHTSDLTSTVSEVFGNNLINMIPRNIGEQSNFNLTVTQQLKLAEWWNMSITGMGYRLQNNVGTDEYGNYRFNRFSGTVNVQQSFKLPYHITGEIASVVNSKTISGLNTYVKGNSQVDLGLQKSIINDKAAIRLAVTDLFWTNRYNTDTELRNLILHTTYRGESRQVRLNFTYKFGSNKIKARESRETGLQNETQRL